MVSEKKEIRQGDNLIQIELSESAKDSITLKKDAKGNYSYEIKLYGMKGEELIDRVFAIADKMNAEIEKLQK